MTFSVRADRKLIRIDGGTRRFVRVEMKAPDAPPREGRLPVNLAFVLDRSGSMHGSKIERAREAVIHGIRSLSPEDRFAVVAYDGQIDVVVPSTAATPEARDAAASAVGRIQPRGCTDLCGGWLRGCEQVGEALAEEAVGRCLLLTDGLANEGITSAEEILNHARALRERRVATTTFGVGEDFDEQLLRRMADAGGGNFYFVESAAQIPDFIASEVGEALQVTAPEAALVVECAEGVEVESLNGFPCQAADGSWRVELGSLFSGQGLDPVLGLTFPAGKAGDTAKVTVRAEDREGALGNPADEVTFEWAADQACDEQERDVTVARRVAFLEAAKATQQALERNQAGQFDAAREIAEAAAAQIRRYGAGDPEIESIVADLERQVATVAQAMSSYHRKMAYVRSHGSLTMKPQPRPRRRTAPVAGPRVVLLPMEDVRSVVDPVVPHLVAADGELFSGLATGVIAGPSGSKAVDPLPHGIEAALLREAVGAAPDAAVRIVFTRMRLADNWFSHWHQDQRTAVVSLSDWNDTFEVSPLAFVAYEVIHHGLRAVAPHFDPLSLAHDETRGCLFDFCETRADVEIKLQAADLCPDCRRGLAAAGLPVDRLLRLAETVRSLGTAVSQTVH